MKLRRLAALPWVLLFLGLLANQAGATCWSTNFHQWPVIRAGRHRILPITGLEVLPTNYPAEFLFSFERGPSYRGGPLVVAAESNGRRLEAAAEPIDDHGGYRATFLGLTPGEWKMTIPLADEPASLTMGARALTESEARLYQRLRHEVPVGPAATPAPGAPVSPLILWFLAPILLAAGAGALTALARRRSVAI